MKYTTYSTLSTIRRNSRLIVLFTRHCLFMFKLINFSLALFFIKHYVEECPVCACLMKKLEQLVCFLEARSSSINILFLQCSSQGLQLLLNTELRWTIVSYSKYYNLGKSLCADANKTLCLPSASSMWWNSGGDGGHDSQSWFPWKLP